MADSATMRRFCIDVLYENERWYPLVGWSALLLPTDRNSTSTEDGKKNVKDCDIGYAMESKLVVECANFASRPDSALSDGQGRLDVRGRLPSPLPLSDEDVRLRPETNVGAPLRAQRGAREKGPATSAQNKNAS